MVYFWEVMVEVKPIGPGGGLGRPSVGCIWLCTCSRITELFAFHEVGTVLGAAGSFGSGGGGLKTVLTVSEADEGRG